MKKIIVLATFCICTNIMWAQSTEIKFNFGNINYSYTPPAGFAMKDSSSRIIEPNSSIRVAMKEMNIVNGKNMIYLVATTSTQQGIDWENIHLKESPRFYDQIRLKNKNLKLDSATTKVMIDNVMFNKFSITGIENGVATYNYAKLSSYVNDHRLNITYHFTTKEMGEEIERSLASIRFK